MHILWVSDSPDGFSSYGNQTKLLVPRIVENSDHKITVMALNQRIKGTIGDTDIPVLPSYDHPYGYDIIPAYVQQYKPDIVFLFKDGYVFDAGFVKSISVPVITTGIIDTEPMLKHLEVLFNMSMGVLAPTKWAQQQINHLGTEALYTPLGYDPNIFYPVESEEEKRELRKSYGIPEDAFYMLMVGNNNTAPLSRKLFDTVLVAFASMCPLPDHESVALGLQTDISPGRGGLDLEGIAAFLGVLPNKIFAPNPIDYHTGIEHKVVADLMRMADVLVNPSMGEGFCLPVVEAQACGTRVVTNNFTAMRETTVTGYRIDPDDPQSGDMQIINNSAFRFRTSTHMLFTVLDGLFRQRDKIFMPDLKGAEIIKERYAIDDVVTQHWVPALNEVQSWLKGDIFTCVKLPART